MTNAQYVRNGRTPDAGTPPVAGHSYQPNFEPPYLIPILGHAGAGKDTFKKWLGTRFTEQDTPHKLVINYKERDPRSTEIAGLDYEQITSETHNQRLLRDRKIIVPYKHDGRLYGLSGESIEALSQDDSALMITEPDGLYNLSQYSRSHLQNMIISILLHTNIGEAERRVVARAKIPLSAHEIDDINAHRAGLPREFEIYKSIEDMCRYVFRNDRINGQDEHTSVRHLVNRATELIGLEKELNASTNVDFREAYVNLVVQRLFGTGTSLADLVGSANQGLELNISKEAADSLSGDHKLDKKILERIRRQPIVAVVNGYGILSLYIGGNQGSEAEKGYLVDLIEKAVKLTPQYRNRGVTFKKTTEETLKESVDGNGDFLDFAVSFSAYDPMGVPKRESRIHTIAFEGVLSSGNPKIESVSLERAKKIIEGNGH